MPSPCCPPVPAILSLAAALALTTATLSRAADHRPVTFEITRAPGLHPGPISARVYVMLGPAVGWGEPRFGPDWFRPQPFFAVEAKDWKAGEALKVGADATGYPGPLDTLEPGTYRAQAVVRLNPDTHELGGGEGNAYGPVIPVSIDPKTGGSFALRVDKVVPPRVFKETDWVKLVEIDSPLLSAFHKRTIRHRAAVILPVGDLSRKRGTLYIIPGFGGDHFEARRMAASPHVGFGGDLIVEEAVTDAILGLASPHVGFGGDLIRVLLDPDCGTGHHVFADSAFNGPRGQALVEELIPYIEKTFPAISEPRARLLNGHSSGGWSSLWLQVTYPDVFGGTWSTSPDPVDFRDFQQIDLYARGVNMFRDEAGQRQPLARMGTRAVIFYDSFSKLEDVIGDGGQLHSFEAVFSPLRSDGRPRPLWDRVTGAVDPETARAWEKYDIRLVLERNWPTLGPKLQGKLHVVTGGLDSFYLEGAVKLLKASLEKLGSDAVVEVIPGRDHGSVLDATLVARFDREMNAAVGALAKSRAKSQPKRAPALTPSLSPSPSLSR